MLTTLLGQQRPYSAVRLGALSLLTDLLEHRGGQSAQTAADGIYRAVRPVLEAVGAIGLRDVEDKLRGVAGRPPAGVSEALVSTDLATAVAAGLRRLSDDETLIAYADVFSPDPTPMVLAGVTEAPPAQERQMALLLRDLWRRAGEIDAARREAGENDDRLYRTMIDSRVLNASVRLVNPPVRPGRSITVPELATVAKSRRYGNRVGAAMGIVAASRLPDAMRAAGWSRALEGAALLAAIAETVDTSGRKRSARVAESGTPVPTTAWRSNQWLNTLVAWSGSSDERGDTAWRLAAHESNTLVLAAGWAMAIIGGCSTLDALRLTEEQVVEHLTGTTDVDWAASAERGWDLLQSTRRAPDRAPWPVRFPASWSTWSLASTQALPWSLTAGEDVTDDAVVLKSEPAPDTLIRLDRVPGFDRAPFYRNDDGWVQEGDRDEVATSFDELFALAESRGGQVVTA